MRNFTAFFVLSYALAGLLAPWSHADRAVQADALLRTFQAGCPTQGEWTKNALDYTRALIDTFQSIKNDPDCKTAPGIIAELNGLDQQLNTLNKNPDDATYLSLKRISETLLIQLENTQDPAVRAVILENIRTVETEIARTEGYLTADASFNRKTRLGNSMQALVSGTQTLLQQVNANQQCFQKHPSLLSGVVSIAGTVAAASLTSGASLIAMAGAGLYGHIIEFLRVNAIQKHINKASDILVRSAMQCGLEALSNQWCSAQDSLDLIKLSAAFTGSSEISRKHPVITGVQLLKRDVPVFLGWLERLRAGADPSNDATGLRVSRALERENSVRVARARGLGLIEERQLLLNKAPTNMARWQIVKATIKDLGLNLSLFCASLGCYLTTSTPHPMMEVIDAEYAPFFLLGLKRSEVPKAGSTTESLISFDQFDPFTKWPSPEPYKPSLAIVRQKLIDWNSEANQKVQIERDSVLHPDIVQTMYDCLIEDQRRPRLSPCSAMRNISQYIYSWRYSKAFPKEYVAVASDTLTRLQEIRVLITKSTSIDNHSRISDPQKLKIEQAARKIYEIAVLDFASSFLSGRLETAIRLASLDTLNREGQAVLSQNLVSKLMASQNLIDELTRFSGNDDLNLIGRDIKKSQQTTQELLQVFGNAFSDSIDKALHFYKKRASQMRENADGKNNQELAELCFKVLSIPFSLEDVDLSVCQGAQLRPIFKGWPASKTWKPWMMRQIHEHRACLYRDFLRQNRIYQYQTYEK